MISQSLSSLPSFGTKKWFKRYAIIFTILLAVLSSVVLVLNVGQVQPYEALWDSSIKEFKYWNRKIYPWGVVVLQFAFAIWDITLVLFPVLILWKLNMRMHRKVGLIILVASSLVTAAAAVAKGTISLLYIFNAALSVDGSRGIHVINFTACLEQALVIIIGCVPAIRSITQLKHPSLVNIGNSLASLLAKIRSTRSMNTSKESFSRRAKYCSFGNIELTPRLHALQESGPNKDGKSSGLVIASLGETDAHTPLAEGQVCRTDSFSVS